MHPPSLTMHCLSPPFTVIYCSNTFLQQPRDLPFKYFSTAASWSTIQILFYSTLVIYCSNNFLQKPRDLPFKYFPTAALWCRPLLGGAPAPLQYDSFCHQLLSCTLCVTVRTLCVTVCTLCVTMCTLCVTVCTLCVTMCTLSLYALCLSLYALCVSLCALCVSLCALCVSLYALCVSLCALCVSLYATNCFPAPCVSPQLILLQLFVPRISLQIPLALCYPGMALIAFIALFVEQCGVWCLQSEKKVYACVRACVCLCVCVRYLCRELD
jgi:hypothetical protein